MQSGLSMFSGAAWHVVGLKVGVVVGVTEGLRVGVVDGLSVGPAVG